MADVFVGSLMLVPYNFAPTGYAFCQGQLMHISQNTALFSLLGTMYGGDGKTTFALPDLQGSVGIGFGQGPGLSDYAQGETGGDQAVTLLTSDVPSHQHGLMASTFGATSSAPNGNSMGSAKMYSDQPPTVQMNGNAVSPQGRDQPHNNLMPYQALNWIIALQGVFPPRG